MLLGIAIHAQTNAPLISYPTTNSSSSPASTSSTMVPPTQTSSTVAMAGRFGAGLTFGEPIGASAKYFITDVTAVQGSLGWSFADHSQLYLDAAVTWNDYDLLKVRNGAMPVYIGVGPLLRIKDDGFSNEAGIRVPIGASYFFERMPVEIFAEIGPALDVAPVMRGEITGGIGIRYWF